MASMCHKIMQLRRVTPTRVRCILGRIFGDARRASGNLHILERVARLGLGGGGYRRHCFLVLRGVLLPRGGEVVA